jgi:tetratricopeptide (TPR) repeat protein
MNRIWYLAFIVLFSCAEQNTPTEENEIQLLIDSADVQLKKENFSASFSCLEKARALDSTNIEVNLKLSQFYLFLKQWEPAIARANDALKVDRTNAKAYFLKGMAFKDFGDTTKAISNFQTAIEQDANFYEPFIQLGLISTAKHDSSALAYYNNALLLKPASTEALYGKAWFYQSHGKWNPALELYQLIPSDATQYFSAQYNCGYLFFNAKDYKRALKFFNEAAKYKIPKAQYMKGLTFDAIGQKDSAQFYYRRCLAIDSTYAEARKRL